MGLTFQVLQASLKYSFKVEGCSFINSSAGDRMCPPRSSSCAHWHADVRDALGAEIMHLLFLMNSNNS